MLRISLKIFPEAAPNGHKWHQITLDWYFGYNGLRPLFPLGLSVQIPSIYFIIATANNYFFKSIFSLVYMHKTFTQNDYKNREIAKLMGTVKQSCKQQLFRYLHFLSWGQVSLFSICSAFNGTCSFMFHTENHVITQKFRQKNIDYKRLRSGKSARNYKTIVTKVICWLQIISML